MSPKEVFFRNPISTEHILILPDGTAVCKCCGSVIEPYMDPRQMELPLGEPVQLEFHFD